METDHYCSINHEKSSGAVEAAGAVDVFCSSVDKHQLIGKEYVGDGDIAMIHGDIAKSRKAEP